MSSITELPWDSYIFGNKAGKIDIPENIPDMQELSLYQDVHVKIPQNSVELSWEYQKIGFRYIVLDFQFIKAKVPEYKESRKYNSTIKLVNNLSPDFEIKGFVIEGSRLMIDPILRNKLDKNIWDKIIYNHIFEYADYCICDVGDDNKLRGFISCFDRKDELEIFLFAVHPQYQGTGIGSGLFKYLENHANDKQKNITTNVLSANIRGMNFYFKHGFIINNASIVLHYSNLH